MPIEPVTSPGFVDGPAADTGTLAGSGSDAALVLAAVDRMQRAELHARLSLIRLRSGLGEMALTVGRAKAKAANPDGQDREIDTAALLDEFEHRIDAMLEIAGVSIAAKPAAPEPEAPEPAALPAEPVQSASEMPARPAPAAEASAAEAEQVPTISRVVSGCDAEAAAEPAVGPHHAAFAAAGPTVEMLRSLVAALNASIPAEPAAAGPPQAVTERPVPEGAATESAAGPHDAALAAAGPTVEMLRSLVAALNVSIPAEPAAAGPPQAVAEQPVPESAAEVARPAPSESIAEGGPGVVAPEVAASELVAAAAAAAERPHSPQKNGEDTEPLVSDVIVEFDKAELAAPTVAPQEHGAAPEAAAIAGTVAAPEPEAAVHKAVAAPPPDQPAATIEPVVEAPVPETPPLPDAAVGPADQSPQQPAAGQVTAEDFLADLPAIPYEASSPVWVQAALRQDAVFIHEIELLARFEQMEALPLLPPEIGTAVIFNPRSASPPEVAETPQPPAAETETFSAEATSDAAAADTVVTESLLPKALLPETAAVGPATDIPAVGFPAVKAAQAAVAPATQAEPSAEPEAAAGDDGTVEFGLPAALLPSVDFDSAPSGEALAGPEAEDAPAAGAAIPSAEPGAIAAAIAEAPEPGKAVAGPPEQEAPPATAGTAPAAELAAAPVPETDAVPHAAATLPPVDVEFDTDKFLFGEDAAETAEHAANGAENPPVAVAPAETETAGITATRAETQPDPLIAIKAMSPEERIALFS